MTQGEAEIRYWSGNITPQQREVVITYVVEAVTDKGFVYLGTVEVPMAMVYDAQDATMNLKDNMPSKFARKFAREKFPGYTRMEVMPQDEWEGKFGRTQNYKRGDIVK